MCQIGPLIFLSSIWSRF